MRRAANQYCVRIGIENPRFVWLGKTLARTDIGVRYVPLAFFRGNCLTFPTIVFENSIILARVAARPAPLSGSAAAILIRRSNNGLSISALRCFCSSSGTQAPLEKISVQSGNTKRRGVACHLDSAATSSCDEFRAAGFSCRPAGRDLAPNKSRATTNSTSQAAT